MELKCGTCVHFPCWVEKVEEIGIEEVSRRLGLPVARENIIMFILGYRALTSSSLREAKKWWDRNSGFPITE